MDFIFDLLVIVHKPDQRVFCNSGNYIIVQRLEAKKMPTIVNVLFSFWTWSQGALFGNYHESIAFAHKQFERAKFQWRTVEMLFVILLSFWMERCFTVWKSSEKFAIFAFVRLTSEQRKKCRKPYQNVECQEEFI